MKTSFKSLLICSTLLCLLLPGASAISCSAGSYYPGGSICVPCSPGYFCPQTETVDWDSCPPGTFQPNEGAISDAACLKCPLGMLGLYSGASQCYPCPNGYSCPNPTSPPIALSTAKPSNTTASTVKSINTTASAVKLPNTTASTAVSPNTTSATVQSADTTSPTTSSTTGNWLGNLFGNLFGNSANGNLLANPPTGNLLGNLPTGNLFGNLFGNSPAANLTN